MSKGTYDVQKGEVEGRRRRDSSYGSFLCAILIFLILCVIIIIAGNWTKITGSGSGDKKDGYKYKERNEHEDYNPNEDMEFFQRFVVSTTKPPQNYTTTTKSYFTHLTTTKNANQPITTRKATTTTTTENSIQKITTRTPAHETTTRNTATANPPTYITTRRAGIQQETMARNDNVENKTTTMLHAVTTENPWQLRTGNVVDDGIGTESASTNAASDNYHRTTGHVGGDVIVESTTTRGDNAYETTSYVKSEVVETSTKRDAISSYVTRRGTETNKLFDATTEILLGFTGGMEENVSVTDDATTDDVTWFVTKANVSVHGGNQAEGGFTGTTTEGSASGTTENFTSSYVSMEDDAKTTPEIMEDGWKIKYKGLVSSGYTQTTTYESSGDYTSEDQTEATTDESSGDYTNEKPSEETTVHPKTSKRFKLVGIFDDSITESTTVEDTTTDDTFDISTVKGVSIDDATSEITAAEDTTFDEATTEVIAIEDTTFDDTTTEDASFETTTEVKTDYDTTTEVTNDEDTTTEVTTDDDTTIEDTTREVTTTEDTTTEVTTDDDTTTEVTTTEDTTTEVTTDDDTTTEVTTEDDPTTEYTTTEVTNGEDTTAEDTTTEVTTDEDTTTEYADFYHTTTENTIDDIESTSDMFESDFTTDVSDGTTANAESTTSSNYQLTPGTSTLRTLKETERVCTTRGCKSTAANMLSLMDDTEDACEDFYAFACRGASSRRSAASSDVWDVLMKQTMLINNTSLPHLITFRSFYDSCVDFHFKFSYQERVDLVMKLLKSYGMESFKSAKTCDMDYIFKKLLALKSMYFMEVGVDIAEKGYVLKLGPSLESSGEIGPWSALRANQRRCLAEQQHKIYDAHLNLEKVHESYAECLEHHDEFRQLLRDAIATFGYAKNQNINQHFTINYLNKLLGIRPTKAEINEAITNRNFTVMTIRELQTTYPQVNWLNILNVVQERGLTSDQRVHVYFKDYITRWFEIFSYISEQKWLLINLLITDLYYNFVVHKVNDDVQNYCLKTTATHLSDIASNLYLKSFPDADVVKHEKRIQDVFHVLQSKFRDNLKNSTDFFDMSGNVGNLSVVFSSKGEVDSDEALAVKYDDFGKYSSYQEHLLKAKEFKISNLGNVFGGQVNAYDRKAVTFYQTKKIYVPLGMVTDIPFSLPNHIAFAKIGIRLAQSIAKHFDPVSVTLPHFKLTNKTSYDSLITSTDSFLPYIEKKFDKFTVKVNAAMTINERMSDNTALRLLTDAHTGTKNDSVVPWISSSYSREKVMLVAVAQEFCEEEDALDYMLRMQEGGGLPGAVRVYNMFMNSEAFARVFGCVQGSAMNETPVKVQFPYADTTEAYPDYYTT